MRSSALIEAEVIAENHLASMSPVTISQLVAQNKREIAALIAETDGLGRVGIGHE